MPTTQKVIAMKLTKLVLIVTALGVLAGCDSPAGVSGGNTERTALTKAEALSSAKSMATNKDSKVVTQTKPYSMLSRVIPTLYNTFCFNDLVKDYNYEFNGNKVSMKLYTLYREDKETMAYDFFERDSKTALKPIGFIHSLKDSFVHGLKLNVDKERPDANPHLVAYQQAKYDSLTTGVGAEVYQAAARCELVGMLWRGTTPRKNYEIDYLKASGQARFNYLNMRLTEAWVVSRQFGILARALADMKQPSYDDALDLTISYLMDDDVVRSALEEAGDFYGVGRELNANLTGVEGVQFTSSDGYTFSTAGAGTGTLFYMGSEWLTQNYIDGKNITFVAEIGTSLAMSRQLETKADEIKAAINEVAASVSL